MSADSKPPVESIKQALKEEFEHYIDSNKEKSDVEVAKLLADYIENTYKVITDFWKERNRTFIYLVIAVSIALLLSTTVEGTQTIITYLFSYIAKVTGAENSHNLTAPASATLVKAAVPLPIFYLVFNLYQREVFLRRNYFYMHEIEKQIRMK